MKYSCLLIFCLFLCSACNPSIGSYKGEYPLEKKIRKANKERLEKEYLYEVGWGGGGYPATKLISASYITPAWRFRSIDSVRIFFYKHLEDYVHSYNSEPQLRPYLYNFPFTLKNIHLDIYFYDPSAHDFQKKPYITAVKHADGIVSYFSLVKPTTDEIFWLPHGTPIHTESVEEGYAIYKKQVEK